MTAASSSRASSCTYRGMHVCTSRKYAIQAYFPPLPVSVPFTLLWLQQFHHDHDCCLRFIPQISMQRSDATPAAIVSFVLQEHNQWECAGADELGMQFTILCRATPHSMSCVEHHHHDCGRTLKCCQCHVDRLSLALPSRVRDA